MIRRSVETGAVGRKLLLSSLVGAIALGTIGCWNPFAPPESDGPEHVYTYKPRTSQENVLYNLQTAYVDKNAKEYLACLAEEFLFYTTEDDQQNAADPLPESWGKYVEQKIHERMFDEVDKISLTLTFKDSVYKESQTGDPMDATWEFGEDVDLTVVPPGIVAYYANAPQEFHFRIDPLETGDNGEILYEIFAWYDNPDGVVQRVTPGDDGRMSVGALKALFR